MQHETYEVMVALVRTAVRSFRIRTTIMRHHICGLSDRRCIVPQPFPFAPPPPPRLRPDWSSWVVIAAIVLLRLNDRFRERHSKAAEALAASRAAADSAGTADDSALKSETGPANPPAATAASSTVWLHNA